MVIGDQLYSATDTPEILCQKKLTYCRAINKNRKALPAEIKTVKEQEKESYAFFWEKDKPVMFCTYQNLEKTCCLYLLGMKILYMPWTSHKNNLILVDFYNSQGCGVHIIVPLNDYSSQLVSNSWTTVVFTFILDQSVINAQTVLNYISEPQKCTSRW